MPFAEAPPLYALAQRLPGIELDRRAHAYRQPDHRPGAVPQRLRADARAGRRLARRRRFTVEFVDLGGGLGVPYRHDQPPPPLPEEYARLVAEEVGDLGVRLLFEPGRMIAGNAGILVVARALCEARRVKTFTIVDAAMNDLIRPTLYEAYHEILPVVEPAPGTPTIVTDVAGPVCETGDYLALARTLPELNAGDLISVMTAGAYGAVLASEYNSRLLVPEVLVAGNRYSVTRPRPSYDDMLAKERLPNWL